MMTINIYFDLYNIAKIFVPLVSISSFLNEGFSMSLFGLKGFLQFGEFFTSHCFFNIFNILYNIINYS